MSHGLHPSRSMPKRQQRTIIPALMFTILKPSRQIGDTTHAKTEAAQQCRKTISQINIRPSKFNPNATNLFNGRELFGNTPKARHIVIILLCQIHKALLEDLPRSPPSIFSRRLNSRPNQKYAQSQLSTSPLIHI